MCVEMLDSLKSAKFRINRTLIIYKVYNAAKAKPLRTNRIRWRIGLKSKKISKKLPIMAASNERLTGHKAAVKLDLR